MPRCGNDDVRERQGKINTGSNKDCAFQMWKGDRFFEERKIAFYPLKIAAELLKAAKQGEKNLYSPKTGKTYDGRCFSRHRAANM